VKLKIYLSYRLCVKWFNTDESLMIIIYKKYNHDYCINNIINAIYK
jgi:hypothetical protein